MSKPLLLIITGPPAAGKTTLATNLNHTLKLPIISFDIINEALFDVYDFENKVQSKLIQRAAYNVLFKLVREQLKNNVSVIVESNFNPSVHEADFIRLQKEFSCNTVQLLCDTDRHIFVERFKKRWEGGGRHPGHKDDTRIEGLKTAEIVELHPLKIAGKFLKVDTTSKSSANYSEIDDLLLTETVK